MLDMMMKWKNPGITYFGGGEGGVSLGASSTGTTTPAEPTEATPGNIAEVEEQVAAVAADPSGAYQAGQQKITNLQAQIAGLTTRLAEDPGLQSKIDELNKQLNAEQVKLVQAGALAGQEKAATQQEMVGAAISDPGSLIKQAEVATIPTEANQFIDPALADSGAAPQAAVTTVDQTATAQTPARQEASQYDAAQIDTKVQETTGDLQAAVGEPSSKATVRGQLELLMSDFEGGETPPWASGPMRQAMQMMQTRGMGASSIAGAAVVQAAMESAISIASQDATTSAQFEMQNLNNEQQTSIFKTQQRLAGLFSDQAAVNASSQFNASSENQTNQFFSNLEASASQFNTAQINAIQQYNSGQKNAAAQFNATVQNQREQFNTQNSLVISQANAVWRQNIATQATADQNMSNLEYTRNANAITGAALDQLWQRERDLMDYAFQSSENAAERANAIILQKLGIEATKESLEMQEKAASKSAFGSFVGQVATGLLGI